MVLGHDPDMKVLKVKSMGFCGGSVSNSHGFPWVLNADLSGFGALKT